MKSEITKTGWKETKVKHFNINTIPDKPFMKISNWIESNKLLGLHKKRKSCNCCRVPWEKLNPDDDMYLVFTDKGNKTVCADCFAKLQEVAV